VSAMPVLALSEVGVVVLLAVILVLVWVFSVALRTQERRQAAGGLDPEEPPPEPAPDRREPPSDAPS
jgi:hypothetical protein